MNFFDLFNISERFIEIINPLSEDKVVAIGRALSLSDGARVIDFGSGYAEPLVLWAEAFGISGIGIDIRRHVCDRAVAKIKERGLSERIEIVCGRGDEHQFEERSFDAATCIGASFIWSGFRPALTQLRRAIKPGGRVAIGEPYWVSAEVSAEYIEAEPGIHTEPELVEIIRDEGFDLEYVIRSSADDWDAYEAGNWRGLVQWLRENPEHPERDQVLERLHTVQNDYVRFGRQYIGWAVYVLTEGLGKRS